MVGLNESGEVNSPFFLYICNMKLNKDYKQISVYQLKDYDALKGKVVDKIAFTDRGSYDENMFIITFTDQTFICVGTHYKDLDNHDDEPQLENFYVMDPMCVNCGNYGCHTYVHSDGTVTFDRWIEILRDLKIWEMPEEEVLEIIERDKKNQEDREYKEYLRLKEKYEKV